MTTYENQPSCTLLLSLHPTPLSLPLSLTQQAQHSDSHNLGDASTCCLKHHCQLYLLTAAASFAAAGCCCCCLSSAGESVMSNISPARLSRSISTRPIALAGVSTPPL